MPPIPLTEEDIKGHLDDLLDFGVLGYDKITKSYHFTSPKVRDRLFSSLTFSSRTKMHLGIVKYYKKTFRENIKEFYSVLGHHYEGSQNYVKAIKYYEDASIEEYTDGNYRDAVMNYSNLIRLSSMKKRLCKHTNLYKTLASKTLCICTWLGYFAASECHILHFTNSLKLFNKAIEMLNSHTLFRNPLFFCTRMSGRRNLLQRIRSMQTKVQKLIQGKIIKNKSLDIKGMERDIFEDFPPLGWKPSQLESKANKSLEDLLG